MNRLKALRKEKGITQKELSEAFNVAQNTVSGWESGNREPSKEFIKKLAEYFNVSTDYLLGFTDNPNILDKQKELNSSIDKLARDLEKVLIEKNVISQGKDLEDDEYEDIVKVIVDGVSSYADLRKKFLNKKK